MNLSGIYSKEYMEGDLMPLVDNERRIIKKIKSGNQPAFKQLYDSYADYALRTTYAITRNHNHAADIVQETFIKVYRNIDQFDQKRPFKPWFYQILLNESRRYMKRQNKQATAVESEELMDYLHEQNSGQENYDNLDRALDQLSEMHRTVLTLKYMNEFTEREIAQLLELNVNTVKSRLYKGRKQLKEVIGGVGDE